MENYKKFLYISGNTEGQKLADIKAAGKLAVNGDYYKTIVFAAETNEIYNRGKVYGLSVADAQRITDLETAVEALQTAQVKVLEGEKVISLASDNVSLQSTLSLDYNSESKKIQLKGIGDAVVADLDATAFIKDSMVSSAELVETAEEDITVEVPYIKIVFNTDEAGDQKDTIRFSVKSLVDVYNAANINLTSAYAAKESYTPANITSGASMDDVIAELVASDSEIKKIADDNESAISSLEERVAAIEDDLTWEEL